jgi:hypothetical protein
MTKKKIRRTGDPCFCTSFGHGHDGERCEKPVTGRTRSGRLRRICDECAHIARTRKHLLNQVPPPYESPAPPDVIGAPARAKEKPEPPAKTEPSEPLAQQGLPPEQLDLDVLHEKF